MSPILSRGALAALLVPALLGAQSADSLGARPIALKDAVSLRRSRTPSAPCRRAGRFAPPNPPCAPPRAALFPSLNLTMGQVNQSGDRFDAQGRLVPYLAPQPWSYSHRDQLVGEPVRRRPSTERGPPLPLGRRRCRGERGHAAVQRRAAGQDAVLRHPRRARVRGRGARPARPGAGAAQGVHRAHARRRRHALRFAPLRRRRRQRAARAHHGAQQHPRRQRRAHAARRIARRP